MHQNKTFHRLGLLLLWIALAACSSSPEVVAGPGLNDGRAGAGNGTVPGTPDPARPNPGSPLPVSSEVVGNDPVPAELLQTLSAAKALDATGLTQAYPVTTSTLSYDPRQAAGLTLLQNSALALNPSELSALGANGVVISKRQGFPSFAYGYKSIYSEDLPLYVSADSILEALHRTFDYLLKVTEEQVLIDELSRLLAGMRAQLATANLDATAAADADFYLAVAAGLLTDQSVAPIAGAQQSKINEIVAKAKQAQGTANVKLFGSDRDEDFSQFTPRGHYTDSEQLSAYFKAMMWLGRVDLRLIETQSDGKQVFHRQQFELAVALRRLMGEAELTLWRHIESTIGAFVGENDSMTPADMAGLLNALNVSPEQTASLTDQQIADEIARGGWGAQRIASRIIVTDLSGPNMPLDRSFLLFGQRYTVDSHTFVNVTYNRIAERLMPEPLDAAFAALGNSAALPLLADEFDNTGYVQGLARTRALVDAHEPAYWEGSLYTRWLGALRSLSPQSGTELPGIVPTAAWHKRVLSAQLGSWAELRHDTILYVKQSYSAGPSCEFPDAYVDPYPEFYARLGAFAGAAEVLAEDLPSGAARVKDYVRAWSANFRGVTANLQKMAENQVTGAEHSPELLAFINDAVKWDETAICGSTVYSNFAGWYLKLYLQPEQGLEYDPVIADVHTQPRDAAGNEVGRVLHVGVGGPRLMVVTANTCTGPRAYVGLATSYAELITERYQRLNDEQWAEKIATQPFPDATWMSDVAVQ
jgi:hypothetical protein